MRRALSTDYLVDFRFLRDFMLLVGGIVDHSLQGNAWYPEGAFPNFRVPRPAEVSPDSSPEDSFFLRLVRAEPENAWRLEDYDWITRTLRPH